MTGGLTGDQSGGLVKTSGLTSVQTSGLTTAPKDATSGGLLTGGQTGQAGGLLGGPLAGVQKGRIQLSNPSADNGNAATTNNITTSANPLGGLKVNSPVVTTVPIQTNPGSQPPGQTSAPNQGGGVVGPPLLGNAQPARPQQQGQPIQQP